MGIYGKWQWFRRTLPVGAANVRLLLKDPAFFARWWKIQAYTMLPYARLKALSDAVAEVACNGVEGDIVECGTARGGSLAMLALSNQKFAFQPDRSIWSFDTFDGIPAPTKDDPDYETAEQFTGDFKGTVEQVSSLIRALGAFDSVHLVKGLFQDTLPRSPIARIAVLHLDGDWYESTRCALENLYDSVAPGGVIQIDDYGYWAGAKKATDEFLANRGINLPLLYIDRAARQIRKV
jgi:hypothetical protein